MKKLFGILICTMVTIFSLGIGSTVSASSTKNESGSTELSDVSRSNDQFKPFGTSKPDKGSVVNLNTKPLKFSGSSYDQTLYTNSFFKGKSTINYSITNYSKYKLTVKVWEESDLFIATKTLTINPNSTTDGKIEDLDKSSLYYLGFSGPSDFEGSVY
ncbi:hypothetical protein [Bacillus atrophaeus]|uniref:hypothetical protein n=1 Tax=Bacillus atrophaeus TaxID=1452 RepID=UPI00228004D3|nr:hypothetical protein [Bacillus atrophaeus]MCY8837621.1 hypothetical protein [Bacillus atrophaeus]